MALLKKLSCFSAQITATSNRLSDFHPLSANLTSESKYVLERETLLDKAMQSYATKLVQGNVVQGNAGVESQPRGEPVTSRILECHRFLV